MKDPKANDLNHIKVLAKIEAQLTGNDRVIINSYDGRDKIFKFYPSKSWDGQIVTTVRYTPEDKRGTVLRDNENGEPEPVKSKRKGQGKRRKAK